MDDFNTNQLEAERKDRENTDFEAKIEDLNMIIETLAKDIEEPIKDTNVEVEKARRHW